MSESHDSPQGPTDPHGRGGADAPAPPGGPQRTDATSGDFAPDVATEELEPQPSSTGGNDVPPPHGDEREQGEASRGLQEENAETSLDEPSDGSGGE